MRRPVAALLAVLFLGLPRVVHGAPTDPPLPGCEPESQESVCVMDGRTGQPIPGAVVTKHRTGWVHSRPYSRGITGRIGVATLPREPWELQTSHWRRVTADGYAPCVEFVHAGVEDYVNLYPGMDRRCRVLNTSLQPLEGLEIALVDNCDYEPPLRTAHTDKDGVAVFPCVTDELFHSPTKLLLKDLASHAAPSLGEYPVTLVVADGVVLEGRILTGPEPIEWCEVAAIHPDQYPVQTEIDKAGGFVLQGVDPRARLRVKWRRPAAPVQNRWIDVWSADRPIQIALEKADETEVKVRVRPEPDAGGKSAIGTEVVLMDMATGIGKRAKLDEHLQCALTAPAGAMVELRVGTPISRWTAVPEKVDLSKGESTPVVEVALHEQPALRIEVDAPDGAEAELLVDESPQQSLSRLAFWHDAPPHLSSTADASVLVSYIGLLRRIPVGPAEAGVRRAVATVPPPTRCLLRGYDPAAHECAVLEGPSRVSADRTEPGVDPTSWSLYTYAPMPFGVIVRDKEDGSERILHPTRSGDDWMVSVPGAEHVRQGSVVRLEGSLDDWDDPPDWVSISAWSSRQRRVVFGGRGPYFLADVHPGDPVRVSFGDWWWLPTRGRVGAPDTVLHISKRTLAVQLLGGGEHPVEGIVLALGRLVHVPSDRVLVLHNVPTDPFQLVASAKGYETEVVQVDPSERSLTFRLRPREGR